MPGSAGHRARCPDAWCHRHLLLHLCPPSPLSPPRSTQNQSFEPGHCCLARRYHAQSSGGVFATCMACAGGGAARGRGRRAGRRWGGGRTLTRCCDAIGPVVAASGGAIGFTASGETLERQTIFCGWASRDDLPAFVYTADQDPRLSRASTQCRVQPLCKCQQLCGQGCRMRPNHAW